MKVVAIDRLVVMNGELRGYDRIQQLLDERGRVIDEEQVPGGIAALSACGGDLSGWTSKFAPFDRDGRRHK